MRLYDRFRQQIDRIDKNIVELLNRRAQVALQIGEIKKNTGRGIFSPIREQQIYKNIIRKNRGPLSEQDLKSIFTEIISASRSLEKHIAVAYLGPQMTYTHLASLKKFGSSVSYTPCRTIEDVFSEVEKDSCDYGVVPIENSIEGPVEITLDMLVDTKLKIFSEIVVRISHFLLAPSKQIKIRKIYSKDQVFGQCRQYIKENYPDTQLVETSSTAEAAKIVSKTKDSACIASILAAKMYSLNIIAKNIEDSYMNITKFLVLARQDTERSGVDKTSIVFAVKDRPGALHDAILPFKKANINMTKIESRPSKKKAWDYYFFVDFSGHRTQKNIVKALQELEKHCSYLNILGSYPVEK